MTTYLLVDGTGLIQNIILWDGVSPYTPPFDWIIQQNYPGADIGLQYQPPG